MASRLVLVLGDLFIPDRAIVSSMPNPPQPLTRQADGWARTFPQKYDNL